MTANAESTMTGSTATAPSMTELVDADPSASSVGEAAPAPTRSSEVDVVVVGAGMAGLYLIHRLRQGGFSFRVLETGAGVGGTWFWNRYPGARCDVQSVDYSYSFDAELDDEWVWSEKYATQPEILRYMNHVADRFELRDAIDFDTSVVSAAWNDDAQRWAIATSTGETISAQHYIMATGCLSMPKTIDVPGADRFAGDVYFTSRWPHEGVDFTGKRVGVIGTGSSAIQSIPHIAAQAAHLTVFQRTPNYSIPADNGPTPPAKWAAVSGDRGAYRASAKMSGAGVPFEVSMVPALSVSAEERLARYEQAWIDGGIIEFLGCYADHLVNPAANEELAEFVRNKVRSTVADPETAEALCPKDYPIGSKRLCVDSGYWATFNRPNVRLVDLRRRPIATITSSGVDLAAGESIELDALVFATGFDAMTGAIVGVDITGRDGLTLKEAWADGPLTYLGLMARGFPNLFMVTGPGSPSVLSNMIVAIEQHVEWITDCLAGLRNAGQTTIEPTRAAVDGWVQHVNDFAAITLFPQANSWYMGANVPGKSRVFMPYPGGVDRYRVACDEVVASAYLGFERRGATETIVNDGVIRRVKPDVAIVLEMMAQLGLPPLESMSPADARMFMTMSATMRPPGPDVGAIIDGVLPGADGDLRYRLFRPASPGPHPVVVYFHGGGWVLGSESSDEPLCRDLCVRSDALVISVDYRHAPEARFPAAVDDAVAAVNWVAANAAELGGTPGALVVAGWSAGANLAAVVCQIARDTGGPDIGGQVLLTPVTDASMSTDSYTANGEGYVLTASLMRWFMDHYADEADRHDPRVSPLHGSLTGLPPALVVTAEFDPLRDEGAAYAAALAAAGCETVHLAATGHTHTSVPAVDVMPSGAAVRAEMAAAITRFTR